MDYTQIILTFLALLGAIITTVIVPWIRRKLSESQQRNLEFYLRILVAAAETAFKDEGAGAEKKQPSHQRSPSSPSLCSLGPFSTSGSLAAEIGTFGAAAIIAQAGAGLCAQCTALRSTVCTSGWW